MGQVLFYRQEKCDPKSLRDMPKAGGWGEKKN